MHESGRVRLRYPDNSPWKKVNDNSQNPEYRVHFAAGSPTGRVTMTQQPQDLTEAIGKRLRAAREACGLSVQQLADRTDGALLKSRIGNYEQGIRRPSIEVACALAEALGNASAAYLLGVDDVNAGFSADEMSLLDRFRAADETGRKTIIAVAETQARFS